MVCQYPGSNVEVMSEADPGLFSSSYVESGWEVAG